MNYNPKHRQISRCFGDTTNGIQIKLKYLVIGVLVIFVEVLSNNWCPCDFKFEFISWVKEKSSRWLIRYPNNLWQVFGGLLLLGRRWPWFQWLLIVSWMFLFQIRRWLLFWRCQYNRMLLWWRRQHLWQLIGVIWIWIVSRIWRLLFSPRAAVVTPTTYGKKRSTARACSNANSSQKNWSRIIPSDRSRQRSQRREHNLMSIIRKVTLPLALSKVLGIKVKPESNAFVEPIKRRWRGIVYLAKEFYNCDLSISLLYSVAQPT